MILVYSYIPVIEEILVQRLSDYFKNDCKWENQFPNFPAVKFSNEYPWVPYMNEGWPDLSNIQETLFPSVTIVTSQDQKSPPVFYNQQTTVLEKTDLAAFQAQVEEEGYLMAPESLTALETHFDTNDNLYGLNVFYQKRDTVNIDITTDDETSMKNRIYDLITLFLVGHGKKALKTDLDIQIIEGSVSGNRSGTYNNEFGRVLRGATIQVEVDYKISQVFYDTEAGVIDTITIDQTVS